MSSAGQQLVAGRIPNERIATTVVTSDGDPINDGEELVVMSVEAPVVEGRTYAVVADTAIQTSTSSSGTNIAAILIREDNSSGNVLQNRRCDVAGGSSLGFPVRSYTEYTADATETKTFVAIMDAVNTADPINMNGGGGQPAFLYVDYLRG